MSASCVIEIPHSWINLPDGRRLGARIWRPQAADNHPVPAILEYLPYRKRDGTAARDESTYPIFAANGYAGVRVDIAGNGESDGVFDDEYSEQELLDGEAVINWIAAQTWCSGDIGVMGISWGGFNALQLGARGIAPLKAAISISSVVDRYNQDIHYKNGCQLNSNFGWANVMLCFASRAPDPALREDWKKIWLQRLNTQPWLLETWLAHQRRDAYWQRGSVCDNTQASNTPTLIIGGWADLYTEAPVALLNHCDAPCKAVNGPWIHQYPHLAWPQPRMDFHAESLRWWDRWLKGIENDAEDIPTYRAFISENTRARLFHSEEQGRWVGHDEWPQQNPSCAQLYLDNSGRLSGPLTGQPSDTAGNSATPVTLCSPQDCGTQCGEVFTLRADGELPGDQRLDDSGSAVFNTTTLTEDIEILGQPSLLLNLAIDQPLGNIIVRLLDVHPDGMSHRVSWGALNLAHRHSHAKPTAMIPGKIERIRINLNQCGYRFLPGHQLRVAISTAYWPIIQPPPHQVTATLHLSGSVMTLPIHRGGVEIDVPEPANSDLLADYKVHQDPECKRWLERDMQQKLTHYHVINDTGEDEHPQHGLRTRYRREETWSISPENPCDATATGVHSSWMTRDSTVLHTRCSSSMSCDEHHFYLQANVQAYDGDELISERQWQKVIARDFM